ncbi:MAG: GNAT family N-acetyltransferase [Pseudomonadota bacterium]
MIIRIAGPDEDWPAIHRLLTDAFAYMEGRIDPPSSLHRMTAEDLRRSATPAFIAESGEKILGCAFAAPKDDALYLGKLAVREDMRGAGLAQRLIAMAEDEARRLGLDALELETRIELTENHGAFAALGFVKTGETAHPGYDRPTSVTMRKFCADPAPASPIYANPREARRG